MLQKAMKTVDDKPKQTPPVKQQRLDTGAAGDSRAEMTFDLSQSVFPPAPSKVKHTSAGAASRDESKAVSCFCQLTECCQLRNC